MVAAAAGALAPEEQHCNTAAAGEPWSWEEVAAAARGHCASGHHARVWLRMGAWRRWAPLPLKASHMGGHGDADCRARGCRLGGMEEEDWREERLREASAAPRGGIGSRVRTRKGGLYTLPIWRDAKGPLVE